jgi:hypothetical protein
VNHNSGRSPTTYLVVSINLASSWSSFRSINRSRGLRKALWRNSSNSTALASSIGVSALGSVQVAGAVLDSLLVAVLSALLVLLTFELSVSATCGSLDSGVEFAVEFYGIGNDEAMRVVDRCGLGWLRYNNELVVDSIEI